LIQDLANFTKFPQQTVDIQIAIVKSIRRYGLCCLLFGLITYLFLAENRQKVINDSVDLIKYCIFIISNSGNFDIRLRVGALNVRIYSYL
jgi:hypothetical protein